MAARIHAVSCSMNAHVLAAITASVIRVKPAAMDLEITSSSVPKAGQPGTRFARFLVLELAFLEQVEQRGHRHEYQRGIAQQHQHDMQGQPGIAQTPGLATGPRDCQTWPPAT